MRDLTSTGYFKPFFGAGVCFYFWHLITYYSYSLLADLTGDHFLSLVGNESKKEVSFSGGEGNEYIE